MFKNKSTQRDGFAIDTLIGPEVVIRGDLEFSGGLYVEGRILGKVVAAEGKPASLLLAEQGKHLAVLRLDGRDARAAGAATTLDARG